MRGRSSEGARGNDAGEKRRSPRPKGLIMLIPITVRSSLLWVFSFGLALNGYDGKDPTGLLADPPRMAVCPCLSRRPGGVAAGDWAPRRKLIETCRSDGCGPVMWVPKLRPARSANMRRGYHHDGGKRNLHRVRRGKVGASGVRRLPRDGRGPVQRASGEPGGRHRRRAGAGGRRRSRGRRPEAQRRGARAGAGAGRFCGIGQAAHGGRGRGGGEMLAGRIAEDAARTASAGSPWTPCSVATTRTDLSNVA